jgi:hypothetical protein
MSSPQPTNQEFQDMIKRLQILEVENFSLKSQIKGSEIPTGKQTICKCVFSNGDNVPEKFEYPYDDSEYVGLSFDGKELSLKARHDGMKDGSSYGNGYGCAGCEANIDDGECECVGSPMCSTHKFLVKDYAEYLLHVEFMKADV